MCSLEAAGENFGALLLAERRRGEEERKIRLIEEERLRSIRVV
jgi:hypothetical protein